MKKPRPVIYYSGISVSQSSSKLLWSLGSTQTEHHTTLIYSTKLPRGKVYNLMSSAIGKVSGIEYWEGFDKRGYTVAIIDNPEFHKWFKFFTTLGCEYDFEYRPHITLDVGKGDTSAAYQSLIGEPIYYYEQYIQIFNHSLRK